MVILKVDMLVKAGTVDKCKEYLRALRQRSRKEPGCLMYVGHQSTSDPHRFLLYEQYKDHAALDAHRSAPYFKQYVSGGLDPIMEQRSRELYTVVD